MRYLVKALHQLLLDAFWAELQEATVTQVWSYWKEELVLVHFCVEGEVVGTLRWSYCWNEVSLLDELLVEVVSVDVESIDEYHRRDMYHRTFVDM